jgi:hypothetical protein
MDTLLVVVTLVSLVLGLSMAVFAWKLLREARSRSAARIEALEAMAFADDPVERMPAVRIEAIRTPARVVSRERDISSDDENDAWDLPLEVTEFTRDTTRDRRRGSDRAVSAAPLFEPTPSSGAGGRRSLALAAVAMVMVIGVGGVYALRSADVLVPSALTSKLTAANGSDTPPLELTSLRNDITADGEFVVTGLVHNPAVGIPRRGVVAVVYLFDQEGHYFASGRAALELPTFQPGDESPFVVRVPASAGVSKYRVGFRMEDGGVVAHVDRRGQPPSDTTGDTLDSRPVASPISAPRRSES